MERAMFGAGCFWNAEAAFRRQRGVLDTVVGYCGGDVDYPTYELVATGMTGHVQAVALNYDPDQVTYTRLLETFWQIHDPTLDSRLKPTFRPEHRSVIFYFEDGQCLAAEADRVRQSRSGTYTMPIVTEILPAGPFYPAEAHHQRYYERRGVIVQSLFGRPFHED